jgi:hypothetical protein
MNNVHQFPGSEVFVLIPGVCAVIGTFTMIFVG